MNYAVFELNLSAAQSTPLHSTSLHYSRVNFLIDEFSRALCSSMTRLAFVFPVQSSPFPSPDTKPQRNATPRNATQLELLERDVELRLRVRPAGGMCVCCALMLRFGCGLRVTRAQYSTVQLNAFGTVHCRLNEAALEPETNTTGGILSLTCTADVRAVCRCAAEREAKIDTGITYCSRGMERRQTDSARLLFPLLTLRQRYLCPNALMPNADVGVWA